ncbi:hypothetical protein [Paraflavitalea pollutisoli]|uniref:hypothetical protein n=1 Tax=Paraflavitalea pollutisoli TaxID=3034143 RepID=UPI0023ED369D|nr:hypothetical protein [Paraflavitalea sp. H1-2-19X]
MDNVTFHYALRPSTGGSAGARTAKPGELLIIAANRLQEGFNTVELPERGGILELVKRGDHFLNLVWIDEAGMATRLEPKPTGYTADGREGAPTITTLACFGWPEARHAMICLVA